MDQTPRPDESRDDHQDHQRDLDAEFAALMGDVEIPDDLSTEDLGAEQATGSEPGRQAPVARTVRSMSEWRPSAVSMWS